MTRLPIKNQYAVTIDEQLTLARAFFESGIFQDIEDQAQALVKIVKGAELGLPPVTAMENIDILKIPATQTRKARVSLYLRAHAAAALLRSCGYGDFTITSSDKTQCTITFLRRTHGRWETLLPITYTLDLAKRNRLVRDGSPWETDPENMLYQRAVKRGVERYFPELLRGLQISTADDNLPPVTEEQAQQTIADLYGDPVPDLRGPLAPAFVLQSDEAIDALQDAPQSAPASQRGSAPLPVTGLQSAPAPEDWRDSLHALALTLPSGERRTRLLAACEDAQMSQFEGEDLLAEARQHGTGLQHTAAT